MWLDFQRPFAESCNKLVHVTNHEQNSDQPRLTGIAESGQRSEQKSLIPDGPTMRRLRQSHFLKQSRINSFVEHVTRIMGRMSQVSAAMT
jgi:hypothetical protein